MNLSVCYVKGKTNQVIHHEEVKRLNLNSSNVSPIPDNWFLDFINLNNLDLSNCNLSTLDKKSFEGLSKLLKLDLSLNSFIRLKQIWFDPLMSLRSLTINNCGVRYFEPSEFKWQGTLVYLSMKDNNMTFMPPLPLETSNNKFFPWEVHLQRNRIHCSCRRKEHTPETLTMETFTKVHSSCLNIKYNNKGMVGVENDTEVFSKRVKLLWNRYILAPVCKETKNIIGLETNCDMDGICTAQCNSQGQGEPSLEIFNTALAPSQGGQYVSSAFTLGADPVEIKCNMETPFVTVNTGLQEGKRVSPSNITHQSQLYDNCGQSETGPITYLLFMTLAISIISNIVLVIIIYKPCEKTCQEDEESTEADCGYIQLIQQ